jgi:RND family efflux transporter MFP subunit
MSALWSLPAVPASEVRVGETATLSTADLPDRKFKGTVARTASSLDPSSRTLLVEIEVPNPDGKLLPGTYAQVDLNLPRKDPPLLIPSDTLVVRPSGTLVALVDANNIVHFKNVTVGRDFGDHIEVLSGLKEGQRVIVNPNDSVQEGVKVHPAPGK